MSSIFAHLLSVLVGEQPHVRGERWGDGGTKDYFTFIQMKK